MSKIFFFLVVFEILFVYINFKFCELLFFCEDNISFFGCFLCVEFIIYFEVKLCGCIIIVVFMGVSNYLF